MSAWKVKLFVFWLVIGSSFLISSCTLPTLWDTRANPTHQEATPKSEASSQANTSSGEQAYTGVLSLSGAVKILTEKREEYFNANNYNYDFANALTTQELQWLSNWLTQEKNAIKPYDPKFCYNEKKCEMRTLFEISIGNDEKYYWINDNGEQTWDMSAYEWVTYIHPRSDTQFAFLIREKGKKKDVVDIDSTRPFEGDIFLSSFIFDEKNQVFEKGYLEFDRAFKNKRTVNEYILVSLANLYFDEKRDELLKKAPLNIQYLYPFWWDQKQIIAVILENSPSLRTSLAKIFATSENDISKMIALLAENRAMPNFSHMNTAWDTVTLELDWLTFTRLKNLGLPQGKHTYTLPKKAVMEMVLTESSTLKQEFIEDFGENSGKPFGVALWDKWPNGEDLAWFAWWTSLRPLVVDVDHATYSIPTFDFVFPTMDGAKSLKNEFWRDIVELIQDENSTLPYGSANEKKNLDFAWMRQKNGKIWTASTGNHKWHASDDIDAKSFRPIGGVWWRDITGFTIYLEQSYDYKWQWPRVGDLVPRDAIVIDDRYFYSKKEHKIYHHQYGSWSEISVVGTKVYWVKKYSTLDSPDSLCTSNDEYGKYSYDIYDEKVCYGKSGVVGTRK